MSEQAIKAGAQPGNQNAAGPHIRKGSGFHVGQDFSRVQDDTPIRIAPDEFANPGHVIGYIKAQPESKLGFLKYGNKSGEIRVHVKKELLGNYQDPAQATDMNINQEVIHCRAHAGQPITASKPWSPGEEVRFCYMPAGIHTIVAGFRNGAISLTVDCDRASADAIQASYENWLRALPKQKPFGCIEHREQEASVLPKRFEWSDENEGGVYMAAEPTALGAQNVNGKIHRSWSPSFTTDADYSKATERNGVLYFPEGVRGSASNPARITGIDFCVGTLTNKPAFLQMPPVKARNADTVTAGTSEGVKKSWETRRKGISPYGHLHAMKTAGIEPEQYAKNPTQPTRKEIMDAADYFHGSGDLEESHYVLNKASDADATDAVKAAAPVATETKSPTQTILAAVATRHDAAAVLRGVQARVLGTVKASVGAQPGNKNAAGPHNKVGKYIGTPHKTIEQILSDATRRAAAGEHPLEVANDLIDGHELGHGSVNANNIHKAAAQGAAQKAMPSGSVATTPDGTRVQIVRHEPDGRVRVQEDGGGARYHHTELTPADKTTAAQSKPLLSLETIFARLSGTGRPPVNS